MITWVAGSFTFLGLYLAGRKTAWAWVVALIGQVFWLAFSLQVGDSGLLVSNLVFSVLYFYNLLKWKGREMFILLKPFMPKRLFNEAPQTKRKPRPLFRGEVSECETCGLLFIPGGAYQVEYRTIVYSPEGVLVVKPEGVFKSFCNMHRPPFDIVENVYTVSEVRYYRLNSLGDEWQVNDDGSHYD